MITKLTSKQEKLVSVYRDKWLSNGRSIKRINKKKAIAAIKTIYECASFAIPKYFFFFPSPLQCQLAVNVLKTTEFKKALKESNLWSNLESNLGSNLRSNLWSNLGSNLESNLRSNLESNLRSNLESNLRSNLGSNLESNLGSNLGSNLWSNLESNLWSNLRSNLWSNLESNLGSNLESNLRSNLGSNLGSNLESNLRSNLRSNLWSNLGSNLESKLNMKYETMFYGNIDWDIGWIGFYDFILNEIFEKEIKQHKSFISYMEALKQIHIFIPYKDIVFISDRPTGLTINSANRLHNEDMPAMTYSDGYSLFYLNGINVPKEIIEMPKNTITKDLIFKESNADIRREIIRKVGMDRLFQLLEYKVLDKFEGYELISFDIGDGRVRPWLKMTNPSMSGVVHIEGVRPEITTVKEAIKYRNGLTDYEAPIALS